jgi:hypothetical protein
MRKIFQRYHPAEDQPDADKEKIVGQSDEEPVGPYSIFILLPPGA